VLLAAPAKMGKSMLAHQMVQHAAREGRKVLRVEIEMAPEQHMEREVEQRTGISSRNVTERTMATAMAAAEESALPTVFWMNRGVTLEAVEARARRLRPDLIVVDHMGIFQTAKKMDEREMLETCSLRMRQLAIEINAAVLLLVQASGEAEMKYSDWRKALFEQAENPKKAVRPLEPQPGWVRGARRLVQDADLTMYLFKDGYAAQTAHLLFAHNRLSAFADTVNLRFGRGGRVEEAT
jgi:replicative DNA helicase